VGQLALARGQFTRLPACEDPTLARTGGISTFTTPHSVSSASMRRRCCQQAGVVSHWLCSSGSRTIARAPRSGRSTPRNCSNPQWPSMHHD